MENFIYIKFLFVNVNLVIGYLIILFVYINEGCVFEKLEFIFKILVLSNEIICFC